MAISSQRNIQKIMYQEKEKFLPPGIEIEDCLSPNKSWYDQFLCSRTRVKYRICCNSCLAVVVLKYPSLLISTVSFEGSAPKIQRDVVLEDFQRSFFPWWRDPVVSSVLMMLLQQIPWDSSPYPFLLWFSPEHWLSNCLCFLVDFQKF